MVQAFGITRFRTSFLASQVGGEKESTQGPGCCHQHELKDRGLLVAFTEQGGYQPDYGI